MLAAVFCTFFFYVEKVVAQGVSFPNGFGEVRSLIGKESAYKIIMIRMMKVSFFVI